MFEAMVRYEESKKLTYVYGHIGRAGEKIAVGISYVYWGSNLAYWLF